MKNDNAGTISGWMIWAKVRLDDDVKLSMDVIQTTPMTISMIDRIPRMKTARGARRANVGLALVHFGSPWMEASRKSKRAADGMVVVVMEVCLLRICGYGE